MTTLDLDALEAALAKATPGPWREHGRDIDHDKMVAGGRNPGDACGLGCEIEGPPEPMLRGQFGNHADAAAIVAVMNAAPQLIAIIKAAKDLAAVPCVCPVGYTARNRHAPDCRYDFVTEMGLRTAMKAILTGEEAGE